jgi:archaellin
VQFYCNINNKTGYNPNNTDYNQQVITPLDIQVNVEGGITSIDLLGKKIKYLRDNKTIKDILGVPQETQSNISTAVIDNSYIAATSKNKINNDIVIDPFVGGR